MVDQTKLESEIEAFVEGLIADDSSLFIVDVRLKGTGASQRLIIFLDGDTGVGIDTCVSVSRRLGAYLEENEDMIEGKFYLQVSSVGVDQPLKFVRQYHKNIGRSLSIKLKNGDIQEGKLTEVDETGFKILKIEKKKELVLTISFEDVESSKVLVSFK
jgi:ribosome maturation factor RimP